MHLFCRWEHYSQGISTVQLKRTRNIFIASLWDRTFLFTMLHRWKKTIQNTCFKCNNVSLIPFPKSLVAATIHQQKILEGKKSPFITGPIPVWWCGPAAWINTKPERFWSQPPEVRQSALAPTWERGGGWGGEQGHQATSVREEVHPTISDDRDRQIPGLKRLEWSSLIQFNYFSVNLRIKQRKIKK